MSSRPNDESRPRRNSIVPVPVLFIVAVCVGLVHLAIAQVPGMTLVQLNQTVPFYPSRLTAGQDGRIWFSEERLTPHSVGYFTLDGKVTKFAVPCAQCNGNGDHLAYIESIVVGPDGNLWFPYTEVNGDGSPLNGGSNNFIGRMTPAGSFANFPIGTIDAFRRYLFASTGHSFIAAGPDGNLYFTENAAGKIGRITTAGIATEFPLPSPSSGPSGIVAGPDGNLWVAETAAGKFARLTPSGTITEFATPRATATAAALSGAPAYPFAIASVPGPSNILAYTDWGGAVGTVTTAGNATRLPLESGAVPDGIVIASDGNAYFPYFTASGTAGSYQGNVAWFNPTNATVPFVVTKTPLPDKAFGSEIVAAIGKVLEVIVAASQPDASGTAFVDTAPYALMASAASCVPPITINGQPSPYDVPPFQVTRDTIRVGLGMVDAGGFSEPIANSTFSGNLPAAVSSYDLPGGHFGLDYGGSPDAPGLYNFSRTLTDSRGCSATINYHLTIVAPSGRHQAVGK